MSGGLEAYSSEQLQAELRRRKDRPPPPAFFCPKCGETAAFWGGFSPARFAMQADSFARRHRDCKPLFGGGGI